MSAHTVGVIGAVVTAAVFLLAGITKVSRPQQWRTEAQAMGVAPSAAAPVPYVELVVGALLVVQLQRHVVAWVAVGLLVAFTTLLVVRLAQGQRPACACFGALSPTPIGAMHVLRNVAFIAVAVVAATA